MERRASGQGETRNGAPQVSQQYVQTNSSSDNLGTADEAHPDRSAEPGQALKPRGVESALASCRFAQLIHRHGLGIVGRGGNGASKSESWSPPHLGQSAPGSLQPQRLHANFRAAMVDLSEERQRGRVQDASVDRIAAWCSSFGTEWVGSAGGRVAAHLLGTHAAVAVERAIAAWKRRASFGRQPGLELLRQRLRQMPEAR